jgi:PAS domain S-box-containing protein
VTNLRRRDGSSGPALSGMLRIALSYATFAALWILLSDALVAGLFKDPSLIAIAQTIKGWLFVAVTALLLFVMGKSWQRRLLTEARGRLEEREIAVEFLRLVNESSGREDMIRSAVTFFQGRSGCEAVGIRLKDGEDYPYYEARGFPVEFVRMESSLCAKDTDGGMVLDGLGNPVLECMCGNVISGRFDPSKPFFSEHGSFWTNSTTELLASTTDEDRQARTRNRCHGEGYESVALIALKAGEKRLGLLQLNDRARGRFSPDLIAQWEGLAGYLAVAVAKFQAEEELRTKEELYRSLFENMLNGFAYCRMIFEQDRPADFIYLNVNEAFETLTGLKNVVGRRVTEIIPGIREADPGLFEIYGRVSLTGRPERFEVFVDALQDWFSISAYSPKREHFVAVFDVITDRKRAEEALRESERKYRNLVDNALVGVYRSGFDGSFLYVNDAMAKIFDCATVDEMLSYPVLGGCKAAGEQQTLVERLRGEGMISGYEVEVPTKTGREKTVIIGAVLEGDVISGMVMDITEQKKLESQLRQAQKMEAIGTLAGGVAHDFNNILGAVVGYGHLLQMNMKEDAFRANVEQILEAADRGAALTRSLLAFSRKQVIKTQPIALNRLIARMEKFIKRIIGEDIIVRTELAEGDLTVMADTSQMEQILMNLAANARDAMPRGGSFALGTRRVEIDEAFGAAHGHLAPGPYALLTAVDTGEGMDEETRRRIFEPFFTTKELGRGTGLGLSVVYGIVKQHDGYIDVTSEPAGGAAFHVYLPLVHAPAGEEPPTAAAVAVPAGRKETILVAEDDATLRKLSKAVLESAGYTVITAADGEEAIRKFSEHGGVDLVLLDVIMPRKNGKDAYQRIKELGPGVKAVFVSGYTADKVQGDEMRESGVELLLKPVSPRDLLKTVREVLDH